MFLNCKPIIITINMFIQIQYMRYLELSFLIYSVNCQACFFSIERTAISKSLHTRNFV